MTTECKKEEKETKKYICKNEQFQSINTFTNTITEI